MIAFVISFAFGKLEEESLCMNRYLPPKLRFLVISCCLLLAVKNFCQGLNNFKFEHFTSENGLSENMVYTVFQDSKGYLWIGTHDGLNRYDGYSFKKFRHDPDNNNSLPGNTINSICED